MTSLWCTMISTCQRAGFVFARTVGVGDTVGSRPWRTAGVTAFIGYELGSGRPPAGVDPADYVLLPLTALERHVLRTAVERASDAVECLIAAGIEEAMNRFNGPITDQTCDTQGAK